MTVHSLLFDLQGVLYQDGVALPGAVEALAELQSRPLALRFLTNTTTRPRSDIVQRMQAMGFDVTLEQVFTPARAAVQVLASQGVKRVHLAAPIELGEDFADFDLVDADPGARPDAVVMGDLHTAFTWERLDGLFRMVHSGAQLVALHKNRYCRRGEDLGLDLGPFVAALEYAASCDALVVGKPSRPFFLGAVKDMGLRPEDVVMIGDDIESDIGGALGAGLQAIQVQTGKYTPRDDAHPTVHPTARIPSLPHLSDWLNAAMLRS